MFLFLVLCAFLQTLRGASVPPPYAYSAVATVNVLSHMAREPPVVPNDEGQQLRTVYAIVQSCLLTIFACVWTSAHPNINGLRDSWWTCMKRKLTIVLYAMISPELMVFWALKQRQAARRIAEMYNTEFAIVEKTETSFWGEIADLFRPLPEETTWRGDGQLWTATHGFFIQMGGFILYNKGYPREALTYDRLAQLLRDKAIDAPTVTERNLQDRSKGDAISKAIIVLQTSWFVLQCIARLGQHLPLSELEVLTLAFAVVNVAIYAVWWNKPQGVDTAICVPLKPEGVAGAHTKNPEPVNLPLPEDHSTDDNLLLIPSHEQQPNESTGERHSWLRRMLQKDHKRYDSPFFFLVRLPYRIATLLLHFLGKITLELGDRGFKKEDLRVPMFYSHAVDYMGPLIASCIIGIIFSAVHLLAWESKFPSTHSLVLWRVSAVIMTVEPLLMLVVRGMVAVGMDTISAIVLWFFILLTPAYIAARFVVVIVALLALHHPHDDVLRDIVWTSYIPHF